MVQKQLRIPDSVIGLLREMHPHLKRKIKFSLRMILENPASGKELKDELKGLRSIRVSKLRIIYRIRKRVIEVVAIGPRVRIYEETESILRRGKRAAGGSEGKREKIED